MHPAFVKRWLYPLHEHLLGRNTFACLNRLERSQWLSPQGLANLRQAKLRALFIHAARHCPFYRLRFARAQIVPQCVRLADLARLPLCTKADIRNSGPLLTWHQVPGGLQRYSTGGSTGEPLVFYFDRRRQAYDQAARMRTHRWFGVDVGEPEVYLWGSPIELTRQNRLRRIRDRLTNQFLLSAFDMSPADMDRYLARIERCNPVSIFGYPSSMALLAARGLAAGRKLTLPRLRAVFVTGETLTAADRTRLQSYFGVPVADGYGSREGGFIAHQCPQGRWHVTDENVILEILDRDNRPVAPGRLGRIVLTHLDAYAMPFIRYLTGDLARADPSTSPCPCGRSLSTIQAVEGRKTDFLVGPDGTVRHALSVIYVLREHREIERYRIVQEADYAVRLEVVCRHHLSELQAGAIRHGLIQALGPGAVVRICQVPEIEPGPSGKHRPVISHVDLAAALT